MPLIGHGQLAPDGSGRTVRVDPRWLAAAVDLEQHDREGRCPGCRVDGCAVRQDAELTVRTLRPTRPDRT
ncbi:hypothetical protein [Micromonospora sp. NBC_01813]|uniref:hypothetical protein n=1 Tax=Micromonospora sp. NBC_01813 TaxID=2975988 RepID=UPI002DD87259|nr:hypothetical protein [Micromonospora sp. NBC_01813]WSA09391.1 hypothetical protein OG958_00720 [Micromonospora sp. NBC_01813]